MTPRLHVLVYVRESLLRYRDRLHDSESVTFHFCCSTEDAEAVIEHVDVILGSVLFPATLLERAFRTKWIHVAGAGVDAFLAGSRPWRHDILLTRSSVSFGNQIAEYILGHLLAMTQRVCDLHHLQQEYRWQPLELEFIRGRTLGIAGAGTIGRTVAARARGMGMRTLGLATSERHLPEFDAVYTPLQLEAFLPQLNVLAICLPLTPDTAGLFGKHELALLPPSAVLINVGRGAIVDEGALLHALKTKQLRAAILDVFEREPLPTDHPFWSMPNVTITPHHSGHNIPDEIIDTFLDNLERWQDGRSLIGVVDPSRGY